MQDLNYKKETLSIFWESFFIWWGNKVYDFVLLFITMVTGPSFSKFTFISAPKIPLSVLMPDFFIKSLKYSNNKVACSGLAARIRRSISFFVICYKGKLTDAEDFSLDIFDRKIHFIILITENP